MKKKLKSKPKLDVEAEIEILTAILRKFNNYYEKSIHEKEEKQAEKIINQLF